MATGVGMGFDLEGLDKAIKNAEKGFENLIKTGQRMEHALTQNFRNVAEQGVGVFVSKLNEAQKFLSNIGYNKGIKEMATDMTKVVDEVNKVAVAINNMGQTRRVVDIDIDIAHAVKKLEGLQERLNFFTKGEGAGAANRGLVDTTNIQEQSSFLIEYIEMLEKEKASVLALQDAYKRLERGSSDFASYIEGLTQKPIEQEQLSAFYRAEEHRAKENAKREENLNRERLKWAKETDDAEAKLEQGKIKRINKRFDTIERREANQRKEEQAKLNTTQGSLASYNQLYSPQGVRSLNQMKTVLKQLETAQANINTATKEGQEDWKQLGDAIKRVKGDIERLNTRAKSFGDIMKKVGYSVGVYFSISAMKNFGKKLVDVTKEFERQKVALQNLLQNKDEANRLWEKTVALAIKSPYTTQQLVTYTKQLAAYRIEHDKLYETTKMLADVSSGLGVEMNRMILAFGQVKAATYLRATELRQFTEAGVNMLDELARLYTELEGVEVKAGDVFERITKRQVVFSDVEEVFERLTSKGGMFFRMQETQAQTLYGQWANLQDIYQVSLDEMGRSVRGGMVFVISTLKTLVENWRLVDTAIESVGAAWVVIKIGNWVSTLKKTDRAARMLAVTFGNIRKVLLSWQGAVGILGALASILYNYFSNLSQVNQRYVDLRRGTIDNSVAFEELAEKVKKNNSAIKEYDKLLKDSTKTEEEINNIQKERNKVISENNKLLAETKDKYQDLLPYVQENADGTLNFDKAVQVMQNRERAYLILQQKAKANLRRDALDTNIGQWREEYNEAEEALIEYQTKLNDALAKGSRYELYGDQLVDLRELYKYIKDVKSIEEFQKALSEMPDEFNVFARYNKYAEGLRRELADVGRYFKDVSDFFVDNAAVVVEALDGVDKNLTLGVGEAAEAEQKKAGAAFDKLLERLGVVDDEVIKKIHEYVNNISREKFNIVLDFNYKSKDKNELLDWQKRYNEFIEKLTEGKNIAELRKISSFEIETDSIIKELDEYIKDQENIINRGETSGQQRYTKEEIENARELLSVLKEARGWFGKNTKETKEEETEELKRLKEQIRLVRQLADDYEEMWKKYGKAYADANIKSDARTNAFAKLELDIEDFAVGSRQDEKNNLGKLLEKALGIEGGKVEVEKAIADVEVEVRWDLQEQANANLSREFENLFGNYELSLELEKLNIPPDLAKQLFGIDSIDLTTLRKELLNKVGLGNMAGKTNAEILNSDAYTKLNEHQRKELADHLQKVSKMEQEAQEERLKRYAKFLTKGFNERINLKIKELRELELLEKDKEKLAPQQYEAAKKGIQDEYNTKILKQEWEEFEKSSQYLNLFDDIENSSNAALRSMLSHLESLKQSMIAAGLHASDLEEILNQIEKVEEELEERTPFVSFGKDLGTAVGKIGEYIKARKEEKKLLKDIENLTNKAKELSPQVAKEQDNAKNNPFYQKLLAAQKHLATLEEGTQEYEIQEKAVEALYEAVYPVTTKHQEITEQIDETNQKLDDAQSKTKEWKEALKGVGNGFVKFGGHLKEVGSFVSDMADKWQSAFGLSETAKADMETIAGVAQSAGDMAVGIGKAMANPADIGAYMQTVSGLMGVFATFGQAHDKEKERQIEREMKLVERLQKVYEDLGDTIKNAYSIDTLNEATKMSRENIMAQIHATERMIEAEQGKKDADHERIEDWKEDIEELKEAMKELEETRLQELGAFASDENKKSGAEAFLDAWMEAYKQTGDGLSGLNEQFDEFFEDMIKKQLLQRASNNYLSKFYEEFDSNIKNWADNEISGEDAINNILKAKDEYMPQLNEWLKRFADSLGVAEDLAGSTAELSGLQAGIQGITEDQADVLASYWNSVRGYNADTNAKVTELVTKLFSDDTTTNPMLSQLLTIAEQTRAIRDLFDSVVGHGNGGTHSGAYLKVAVG